MRRSQSYETDETLSITDDFNFVFTKENDFYCVDKHGIEKINSLQDEQQQPEDEVCRKELCRMELFCSYYVEMVLSLLT